MQLLQRIKTLDFSTLFMSVILLFTITITSCKEDAIDIVSLESVTVSSAPTTVSYYSGDLLDLSGLAVTLSYSDNSLETVSYSDFAANGLEANITTGTVLDTNHSEVKITHTESKKYCIQTITVLAVELSGLTLKSSPSKVSYYEGDALSLEGLVVTVSYNNGTTSDISYLDLSTVGLTVSILDGAVLSSTDSNLVISNSDGTLTVDQALTVSLVEISGLVIKTPPSKITYYEGDSLKLDGLVVTVSYNNETTSDVAYLDFGTLGLTVSILDGVVLSETDSKVVISVTGTSYSVDQALTVEPEGLPEPVYSTVTDGRDGKVYKTVTIGDQIWMAENLDYAPTDGSIPHVTSYDSWAALDFDDAAYCYYNNDSSLGYGCLYTWSAAMDGSKSSESNPSNTQGVCPNGWHLPSDSEWTELETYLISNGYNYDGSTSGNEIAKSMASKIGWNSSDYTGCVGNNPSMNNSSGFSALPGGYYGYDGPSYGGKVTGWWSSTQSNTNSAYYCNISYGSQDLRRSNNGMIVGWSVRCLKN